MLRNLKVAVFLAALAFSAESANAAFVFGPFPDYVGTLTATASVTVNTRFRATIPIPFDGTLRINIRDQIQASVSVTVPVYAASFLVVASTPSMPFNQATDNVMITDVYAMNLNPSGDPNNPTLTGFDPTTPQFVTLGPEQFIGTSGTVYTGTETVSTLGGLSTLLPGYDLSAFSGDPNSIVYVEQTVLPASQLAPEPGSLTLLGVGLIGLVGLGWRRSRGRAG